MKTDCVACTVTKSLCTLLNVKTMKQSINLWWVWLRLSCDEAHYLQTCFFLTRIGNIELAFRFSCFKSFKYIFNKHYSQKCPCKMCKWFTKNCTSFGVVPSPPADDHDRNSRKPSPVERMYAQFTGTWLKIHILDAMLSGNSVNCWCASSFLFPTKWKPDNRMPK